jgi:hypothetical protein
MLARSLVLKLAPKLDLLKLRINLETSVINIRSSSILSNFHESFEYECVRRTRPDDTITLAFHLRVPGGSRMNLE